jgi:seryl-tRNA synthetase
MLELRFIREHIDLVREKCLHRGMGPELLDRFSEIDCQRLALLAEVEQLKNRRNMVSREIAALKKNGEHDRAEPLIKEMRDVSARIKELDAELNEIKARLEDIVLSIPNICDDSVPRGNDDSDNVEIKKWGEPRRFDFTPKPHWEVGEELGILDFETSAKLAGARFALLKGCVRGPDGCRIAQ